MRAGHVFGLLAVCISVLAGCDSSTGALAEPILEDDTVTVAAPLPQNSELPTALDITSTFGIRGGRFPERQRDALEWDFAVRIENGELVLLPSGALDVQSSSQPGITPPILGETFESLREAPGQRTFVRDSAIVMDLGDLYVARSRQFLSLDFVFGGLYPCTQYAKMEPLAVDPAAGLLTLHIVTNENCGDPRLVPVE